MGDYTLDRVLGSQSNKINAVFTDKTDNSQLSQSDFLNLMIAELTNQDFNNTADTSQMVDQMVQFANMQAVQEMASYSQTNYAMSLVGKTVTASRYTVSGELDSTTGKVDKVSLVDDEYIFYIGSKRYKLSQIMSIQDSVASTTVDPTNFKISSSDVTENSVSIKWEVPTEDEFVSDELKYSLYYSKEDNLKTVEDITENGTLAGKSVLSSYTSQVIEKLEAGTGYYINVLVEDANGNKYCYNPIKVQTKAKSE